MKIDIYLDGMYIGTASSTAEANQKCRDHCSIILEATRKKKGGTYLFVYPDQGNSKHNGFSF